MLARLPIRYDAWARLGLFKHGEMNDPAYAYQVFRTHYERAKPPPGFVMLELGPGDTAFSALAAWAFGASASFLVDAGQFATRDLAPYVAMAQYLEQKGHRSIDLAGIDSLDGLLTRVSATYLSDGLESLREIPNASVDLSWSHAVLEHVSRPELLPTMRELRRIARPNGASSHQIDLEDHLSHGLNSLRFADRIWESRLFATSGFYTNRLRRSQLLELFAKAGFATEVVRESRWPALPISRSSLARPFRTLEETDLVVHELCVVLSPAAQP
jgi:hypothetical protein